MLFYMTNTDMKFVISGLTKCLYLTTRDANYYIEVGFIK